MQEWRKKRSTAIPYEVIYCHCGKPQVAKSLCRKHYSEMRRQKDPDSARRYNNKYNKSQKGSAKRSRRRAAVYGAEGGHSAQELLDLRERQTCCNGCSKSFSPALRPTVDHIVPLVRGGSNSIDNLQLLCGPCNSSKGSKTHDEWRTGQPSRIPSFAAERGAGGVVGFPKPGSESGT